MKKTVLGSIMFLAGIISIALLMAGSMSPNLIIDGRYSFWWNLSQYGLTSAFYFFAIIAVIGLAIAVIGLAEKKQ